MHYSFIPNGLVWQEFVARLFVADRDRQGSPVKNFETVSAERLRDYGLDGVAVTRTVKIFQMFFPLWEPGEPRHKRVNNKLSETCRKLRDNAKEISAIIGGEVKLLVLVIPENPDVEMLKHKRKLEGEVPYRINIWGETEITAFLNRHVNVVGDLLPFQTGSALLHKLEFISFCHFKFSDTNGFCGWLVVGLKTKDLALGQATARRKSHNLFSMT